MRLANVLLILSAAVCLRAAEPDPEARLIPRKHRIASRQLDRGALEIDGVQTVEASHRHKRRVRTFREGDELFIGELLR